MRTSTEHGKIHLGLSLAIVLGFVLFTSAYVLFFSPSQNPTSGLQSRIAKLKSGISHFFHETEGEKEELREMEHELAEARKAYDKPDEAAQYLLNRRLPEGETELQYELYLKALEQMRDLPQYSTVQRMPLPSLREMAKASDQNLGQTFGQNLGGQMLAPSTLLGWSSLGPGNIGGRTRALLIHPRTPDIMFAGAASGGVWRTTDGGKSWKPLTDLLPNLAVNALAFDPNNPDTIYAGTGEGYFNADATRGAGIFRSFDGGNTWRRLEATNIKSFYYVNDIVVSKNNSKRIYAATASGVMRSTDGGETWSRVLDEESTKNNGCSDLAIRTDRTTDVVFAACGVPNNLRAPGSVQASIYRNDNAGDSGGVPGQWQVVYTEEGMSRTSLAIAPSNQNVIYAVSSESGVTGDPHSLHAVFRSVNGGELGSWGKVNDGSSNKLNRMLFTNPIFAYLNECGYGGADQFLNQGWYDNTIAVDPLNENIVWVGGIDLFRSDDGGATWGMASFWQEKKTSARYVHADQHVIVFHPQFNNITNRTMFVGTDGGIFRTDTARGQSVTGNRAPCSSGDSRISWVSVNNGYAVTQFYHGAVFPGGQSYLGGTQDNGVITGSDDAGPNNWTEVLSGDGGCVAIDPRDPRIVYAEGTGLSLNKSISGAQDKAFSSATTGISNIGFGFIAPLAMDPSDPSRLWLGGSSLWRTKNGADSWTQASAPLKGSATAIAIAPTDSNFVLAGTDQGYIHRTSIGLNSSADTVWPDFKLRTGTVTSITFDPTNRDIAYATISNFGGKHVYRSVNAGQTWISIDGISGPTGPTPAALLPDIPVNCVVVDPTDPQRLYIGTDMGVFTSPDGGQTWAVENTGFANVPVEWLTINAYNGVVHLFAFTRGRGLWRVPLGQICTNLLSPTGQTFDSTGGRGSVNVIVSSNDCQWNVENRTNWITINSNMPMRGNGAVNFSVAPSPDRKPRTGTFTIAGNSFTVTQAGDAVSVSAATLAGGYFAPESIVAAFGSQMSDTTEIASGSQLPKVLAGSSVMVRDSLNVERPAPLFFVSPNQINYLIPSDTAEGQALVTIFNGKDKIFNCQLEIRKVAPGLFTAEGNGKGIALGQALHYKSSAPNGPSLVESLFMLDASQTRIVARPIDLGPDLGKDSDQVYLVLFGTGIRFRSSLAAVTATVGGVNAPVSYAGAQGDFAGLDQVNILIPRSLVGRGDVELILTVDGQLANLVHVSIK